MCCLFLLYREASQLYAYICVHTHTYTYTCIHMCIRGHTHTCAHTRAQSHTCVHVHTYTCIHTRVHMHTHAYTCIRAHIHVYTCLHAHVHTYTFIHTGTHIYVHMHTYAYTCIHMHTHTYIYLCSLLGLPPFPILPTNVITEPELCSLHCTAGSYELSVVALCFVLFFLAMPHGTQGLSSPTKDGICAPCRRSIES